MGTAALLLLASLLALLSPSAASCERGCSCRGACRPAPGACFGVDLPTPRVAATRLFAPAPARLNATGFLRAWARVLRHVPRCWPRLQALLCAVAWAPCERPPGVNASAPGTIHRPAKEMCQLARKYCPVLAELFHVPPRFLACANYEPQRRCRANRTEKRVSTLNYHQFLPGNSSCRLPLVKTSYKKNWFTNIEECGYKCQTPLFSPYEYRMARVLVPALALLFLLINLFVCASFLLRWRAWCRYPRVIVFYVHCCFLFGCLGWLAQLLPSVYRDIVCRRDGTLRRAEPQLNSGESVTCSLVFALVYFTLMAVGSWLVLLLSALGPPLRPRTGVDALSLSETDGGSRGKAQSRLVFHLLAWILPSVLTIICLTVGEIDGDPLSGVCFVGHFNVGARIGLLLVPLGASAVACLLLLLRIMRMQWILLARARDLNLEVVQCVGGRLTVNRLHASRTSTGLFTAGFVAIVAYAVGIQIYLFVNQSTWDADLRRSVLCEMRQELRASGAVSALDDGALFAASDGAGGACQVESRPNAGLLLLYVVCYFGVNLLCTSLAFDRRLLSNWRGLWHSLTASCARRLRGGYTSSPRSLDDEDKPGSPRGFSWWDLGLFPGRTRRAVGEGGAGTDAGPGGDSEGSELISSSRLEVCPAPALGAKPGVLLHGCLPPAQAPADFRTGHRRSGSLSSARTTPTLAEDRHRGRERRTRRPSQRRHDRGDVRRSLSDCSSASSAAVHWRGSWGSVQSYNSYNPQRGRLEERYANWRVQAALNWTSSMAPFYSHTGLPLNFAWQTPGGGTPGYWGCPPMPALWPIYMMAPAVPAAAMQPQMAPGKVGPQVAHVDNEGPARQGSDPTQRSGDAGKRNVDRRESDEFDSEDEVESMNSDAFDSEDEVISGSEDEAEQEAEEERTEKEDASSVE